MVGGRSVRASVPMVNTAMAICSLRYAMHSCTMAHEDDPRRRSKAVCTSGGSIQVHKHIKQVVSAPHIRVHGEHILRQRVPLPRRISMPILPKRSGVPCAEHVRPFDGRPLVVFGRNNPSPYTVNGRPLYVHLNGLAI